MTTSVPTIRTSRPEGSYSSDPNLVRIPPYFYIHVLDRNSNVTRLETGPQTFIRQDHEKLVTGDKPLQMITLPPRYFRIENRLI